MRLDLICVEYVHHLDASGLQVIRDERAMASPPDRFRAHNRGRAGFRSGVEQTLDAFVKLRCLRIIGVPTKGRVAPRSVARVWLRLSFPTQFTEMFVANSLRVQRFRQHLLVELRMALG